uniref:Uncharacterized protein n=1 Tax=Oryza punctata TaxID=4537 RepID=A0A0E0KYT7_ORYPU
MTTALEAGCTRAPAARLGQARHCCCRCCHPSHAAALQRLGKKSAHTRVPQSRVPAAWLAHLALLHSRGRHRWPPHSLIGPSSVPGKRVRLFGGRRIHQRHARFGRAIDSATMGLLVRLTSSPQLAAPTSQTEGYLFQHFRENVRIIIAVDKMVIAMDNLPSKGFSMKLDNLYRLAKGRG